MKSRDCEMQEMFTHSHRNYSQFTSRACSSFANSNPPCICPLFARQQRLGPCFGWGFMGPISQDTRHGTATRTLSQAKYKAMPNREQRAMYLGSEGIQSQDKQYSTVDYFKVQIYLYICARCPTRAFGTGEYTSQELSAFKLDTPTGDQSLSNQVWHHFITVLMIWQSYLSDQPTWGKQHHHRTHMHTREVRAKNKNMQ